MADDARIEGARDAEREQDMLALPADGDRPDLSDLDTVEVVVRQFLDRQVKFRRQFLKSPSVGHAIQAFMAQETTAMAKAFLGEDDRYAVNPEWHQNGAITVSLARKLKLASGTEHEIAQAYFTKLAADFTEIMAAHEAGQIADEDAKFRVDVLVEEATHALLGLRLDAD